MGIADFLFPKYCLNCKRQGHYICSSCIKRVGYLKNICIECQKPSVDGLTHTKCRRAWGLEGLISIWNYSGVIRQAILKLKYNFVFEVAEVLVDYIDQTLTRKNIAFPKDIILVTIPLHRRRKNWRGFNQVEKVGSLLAKRRGWQFLSDLLVRKKAGRPQTELKGRQRKENIIGVFNFNKKYKSMIANPRLIILFDDVYTTGATIKEAAKVLKRNGAKRVWGLTIVR